ncbi:hypothetical protein MLPF_2441 [Mycobacterium lepromatosis]|nr:hypothetical protein MLPF_2441 [Mycobacterium lepromatosis]
MQKYTPYIRQNSTAKVHLSATPKNNMPKSNPAFYCTTAGKQLNTMLVRTLGVLNSGAERPQTQLHGLSPTR